MKFSRKASPCKTYILLTKMVASRGPYKTNRTIEGPILKKTPTEQQILEIDRLILSTHPLNLV